jgi:hypothetical protein
MLNKIFLAVLLISLLVMAALSYISSTSLNSVGFSPQQIVETFNGYNSMTWSALWITSGLLLILANVVLWSSRKAWSLWATFIFFSIFLLIQTIFIGDKLNSYIATNLNAQSGINFTGILGAFTCVFVAIGVFFNQFLVIRMRDKMFNAGKTAELIETESETEKG